jgi:hypothetical protein
LHDIGSEAGISCNSVPKTRAVGFVATATKDVVISRPSPVERSATPRAEYLSNQAVTLSLVAFQIAHGGE